MVFIVLGSFLSDMYNRQKIVNTTQIHLVLSLRRLESNFPIIKFQLK